MAEDPIDIAKKGRELVERVAKENGISADIDSYIKNADGNYSRAIDDLLESNGHATFDDEVKKKIHADYNVPVITPEYIKSNRLSDEERSTLQKQYEGIQKSLTENKSRDVNTGNWGGGFHATGLSTEQKKRYSESLDEIDKRIEADQQLKDLMPNVTIIKPSAIGPRSLKSLQDEASSVDNEPEFTTPSQFGGGMAMSNPFLPSAEGQQKKAKEKEARVEFINSELEKEKTEAPYYIRAQTAIASSKQLGNDQKDADINSRYNLTDHAAKLSRQLGMAIDDYKATGSEEDKQRIEDVYAHLQEQAKEVAAGSSMAQGIELYAQAKMAMVDAEANNTGDNKYLGRGALSMRENVFAKQAAKQFVLGWKNVAWSLDDMLNGKSKSYEEYLQDTKSRGEQQADAVLPADYRGTPIDAYIEVDGQKFLVDGNGDIQAPIDNKFKNIELNTDIKSKIDKYEGNRDAYKVNSGIIDGHISLRKLVGSNATVAFNMIPIIAASAALAMVPGGEGAAVQYLAGIGTSSLMMFHDNFQEQLKQGKGYNYAHNTALMTTFAQSLVEQGFAIESGMGKALAKGIKTRGLKQELEGFVKMGLDAPSFYREAWGTYKKYLASFAGENLEEEAQAQEGAFFNHIRNGVDYELDPHRFGNTAMSMIFSVGGLEAFTHMNDKSDVKKWNNGYAKALMEPEGAKELIDALETEGAIEKKHADIKRGILSNSKKTFDGIISDEKLTNGNKSELIDLMAEKDRWTMASENIEIGPGKSKYATKASEIQAKIDDLWTKYHDIGEKEGRNNVDEYGDVTEFDNVEKEKIKDDGQKSGGDNVSVDGDVSNNKPSESPVQGAEETARRANQPNSGQDAGGSSTVLESKKADIETRIQDTESKIKRKDLFSDGGLFANELGGSGVNSVPTNHREVNGIEFVEFSNPNTGIVDVIMTGTSNNDFVGYYRLYENGKPTNKWSSKFENQSRNKDNFKTMISGVQEMLPQGHEYTEKTSISTDGLRVWNQQLSRGYELQYNTDGSLITDRVAINGDAIVNDLGINVNRGNFENISVTSITDFRKVKEALLPYLEKFGLSVNNIHWENGTVEIDLPVLRSSKVNAKYDAELKAVEQSLKEEAKKQGGASTVLTPEAEELLANLTDGSKPLFISKRLEKIAKENGIEVTGSMSADDVVNALKDKKAYAELKASQEAKKPVGASVVPYTPPSRTAAPPYTPRISFYDVMGQDAVVVKDGERGTLKQDDGGKVTVEYDNGKIEELGNIDDIQGKALEDSGLKVENAAAVATRTYKVGEDTYISDDLDNAITRDEDGNIKSVTLHKIVDGKPQKTEEFTGQQAENLAYEITLDKFNNLQSNEGIRTIETFVEENAGVVQEGDNKGEATTDGQGDQRAKPKEGELDFNAKPEVKAAPKKKKSRKPLWVSQMFPGMRVKDIEKAKKEVDRKQAEEMALELSKEKEAKKLKPVLVTKAKVITKSGGSVTVEVITPDLRDESIEKIKQRVKDGQITALHGLALAQEKSRKEGKKNYTDKELNDLAAQELREDKADQKEAYQEAKDKPAPKGFIERVKKALDIFETSNEISVLQTILRGKEKFNLASILEHGSIKKFDSHGEESAEYKKLKNTKLVTESGGIKLDQYADKNADAKDLSEIANTVIWAAFAPNAKQAALERLEELDPNNGKALGQFQIGKVNHLSSIAATTKALEEVAKNIRIVFNRILPNSYHGRRGDIVFDEDKPMFFTDDINGADFYSKERGDQTKEPNILTAHIRINKPLRLDSQEDSFKFIEIIKRAGFNIKVIESKDGWSIPREYTEPVRKNSPYDGENLVDWIYVPSVKKQLIKEGYDGIEGWDVLGSGEIRIKIPFKKTQITPITPANISEAYHQAKTDGSNPDLVKAVEGVLGQGTFQIKQESPELKKARTAYETAQKKLSDAEAKITAQQASQPKLFGKNEKQGGLFGYNSSEVKAVIDPLKKAVAVAKEAYDKVKSKGDVLEGQQSLFQAGRSFNVILQKIKKYAAEVIANRKEIRRLSREAEQGRKQGGVRNVEATLLLTGSGGQFGQVKGREAQQKIIEQYAKKEGIWYDNIESASELGSEQDGLGIFKDNGMENQVFIPKENPKVVRKTMKTTDPFNKNNPNEVLDFLDTRISAHNAGIGSTVPYTVIGFGRLSEGQFVVITEQPHVQNARLATPEEIKAEMLKMGYEQDGKDSYGDENHFIADVNPKNVLVDKEGNLHFIDTLYDILYDVNEETNFQQGDALTPVGIETFNNLLKNLNKAIKGVFGAVLSGKEFADVVKKKSGREVSSIDGTVYGFVGNDGKIYLNGEHINANTPIHEYAHVALNFWKSNLKFVGVVKRNLVEISNNDIGMKKLKIECK